MKARIRGTNVEVDVKPLYDETGYFAGFQDGFEYYRAADLVFPDTPDWDNADWESFRREAAKDILAGMFSNPGFDDVTYERMAGMAIAQADELIKQLKED